MRLRGQDMTPYTITPDDSIWLARAVEAEGPIQAQVAAALVNGFCFVRSRGYTKSLTQFIRAYSQPINPRWFTTGDLFVASLESKTPSERAEASKAAERRERLHSARIAFSPGTQAAVSDALNGRTGIPPSATDYAAPNADASGKGYTAITEKMPGVNRLWARPGAETWAGYLVDATDAWPWLVSVLIVGVLAWKGFSV
jgi:hypothetical protein